MKLKLKNNCKNIINIICLVCYVVLLLYTTSVSYTHLDVYKRQTFSSVFMQAWIISAVTEYDEDREKHFYSNVFHKYYVAMFVAATCLISVARIFMRFYVSPDFQIAWKYTPLLILSLIHI